MDVGFTFHLVFFNPTPKNCRMKSIYTLLLFLSFALFSPLSGQQTVGLFTYEESSLEGYTLFNPFFSNSTYLIDNCGRLVNQWDSPFTPAASCRLLENGNLLRTSTMGPAANPFFPVNGAGDFIQEIDWEGNLVWEIQFSDSTHRMHHDFAVLENGNILFPAWEIKTEAEAIQAGRDPSLLPDGRMWSEFIVEVDRTTGEIVWEWHLWDHLIQDFDPTQDNYGVIADHPELLDINRTGNQTADGGANWLHINAIDYNPVLDQILFNSFFLSEFFIIDHSTTTAEAATHTGGNSTQGGDLLYRWGNPQNYDHGTADDQTLFGAHSVHWIPLGLNDGNKIMFFHNGNMRPDGSYSSVDIIDPIISNTATGQYEYTIGEPYGPNAPEWSYTADPPEDMYSQFVSGAQRLSNGNTLICAGANGRFLEIDPAGEIVWEYINPGIAGGVVTQGDPIPDMGGFNMNVVFRITRYEPDFPGFDGIDLTPGDPVEAGFPEPYECQIFSSTEQVEQSTIHLYPNPATDWIFLELPEASSISPVSIELYDALGQLVRTTVQEPGTAVSIQGLPQGIYTIKVRRKSQLWVGQFIKA
jgi:hypothetical protein